MPDHASLDELTARPHARPFDAGEPTVIRLALDADERVDPHTHNDHQVVLYCRTGHIELDLDGETYALDPGDIVRFDGTREVSPLATESSEALVILSRSE